MRIVEKISETKRRSMSPVMTTFFLIMLLAPCVIENRHIPQVNNEKKHASQTLAFKDSDTGQIQYCMFGIEERIYNRYEQSIPCVKENRDVSMTLTNGTKVYPFLKPNSKDAIIPKCKEIKGVEFSCSRIIYDVCSYTCVSGSVPRHASVRCEVSGPRYNMTTKWSEDVHSLCAENSTEKRYSTKKIVYMAVAIPIIMIGAIIFAIMCYWRNNNGCPLFSLCMLRIQRLWKKDPKATKAEPKAFGESQSGFPDLPVNKAGDQSSLLSIQQINEEMEMMHFIEDGNRSEQQNVKSSDNQHEFEKALANAPPLTPPSTPPTPRRPEEPNLGTKMRSQNCDKKTESRSTNYIGRKESSSRVMSSSLSKNVTVRGGAVQDKATAEPSGGNCVGSAELILKQKKEFNTRLASKLEPLEGKRNEADSIFGFALDNLILLGFRDEDQFRLEWKTSCQATTTSYVLQVMNQRKIPIFHLIDFCRRKKMKEALYLLLSVHGNCSQCLTLS